jgi:hypothetical protein
MGLGDAQEGAGSSFGAAVALFPALESAWADVDECGESGLAEAELVAHRLRIGPVDGVLRAAFFLPRRMAPPSLRLAASSWNSASFMGNSVSMMDFRILKIFTTDCTDFTDGKKNL